MKADAVDWDQGRREHLKLSEAAAEQHDHLYRSSNFATGSYMNYEIEVLERWSGAAPDHELVIDLGCGTGRASFVLAKRFDQVFAYDFSPKMIEVANRNKLDRAAGNVLFQVRDVERGLLDLPAGCASFVNSGFGMGSFVESVETFFREVRRLLKPQGVGVFSFYNAAALVNRLALQWRPALAARASEDGKSLSVEFGGDVYTISARAYTHTEIVKRLEGKFDVLSLTTFPTLSALFPQELFEDPAARELCTSVDRLLADNAEIAAGPYIVAVVQRGGKKVKKKELMGYARVLSLMARHNISLNIRNHAPVRNMSEVREVIDARPDEMVKSILVAVSDDPRRDDRHPELYLFGIPANRRLDLAKVARYLARPRRHVRPASQTEVEELTGFSIGSIPPFGMPKYVITVVDARLVVKEQLWCGTGRPTESLRITIADLQRLSTFSVADISKPHEE